MDPIVLQAIAKWPNVPHCYGWLGLDARGNWYMRDDGVQAAGPFPHSKGSLLRHDKLIDFIQRNYAQDDAGQWFFQNGPQRVYVELELTPWVWRLSPGPVVTSHCGQEAQVRSCLVDGAGVLYLATGLGLGVVHTLDMETAADAIEQGVWTTETVAVETLAARFAFVRSPLSARP